MDEPRGREAEILAARRQSLERLREAGVEPFALRFEPTADAAGLRERHASLPPDTAIDRVVSVAGRVVMRRSFGALVFLVVRDGTGDIQVFCSEEFLDADGRALLAEVDLGDIVGATGAVMTTRKGELSVRAERLVMLTKSLRPPPEKWHGLRDADLQQRRRYLQLAADVESRATLVQVRARLVAALRTVLEDRGFVEVETPVMQPTAGGALARPFETHHGALDVDLELRISLELYLKRLLVGGLERVYEIGRIFRNEGIDADHNPEFTMLEAYQAYTDYEGMMELTRALVTEASLAVRGAPRFEVGGREVSLNGPWRRTTLLAAVSEATGEDITLDREDLPKLAERHGVGVDPAWGPGKVAVEMFEKLVEDTLWQPTFVCDFPREVSPLARPHRSVAGLTEQFELYLCGIELVTAYSELTDPDEQRAKFELQRRSRAAGDEEAHPFDEEFLMALEHGMPPAGGLGLGVDRLARILADVPSIRDVILFPHTRPR
jgi:lysyl-tRNA synthetase, class II